MIICNVPQWRSSTKTATRSFTRCNELPAYGATCRQALIDVAVIPPAPMKSALQQAMHTSFAFGTPRGSRICMSPAASPDSLAYS